jgi:hypothetical protein
MLPGYVPIVLLHGQRGQLGRNLIGRMVVPIPLGVSDPSQRLRQIAVETAKRKAKNHPQFGDGIPKPNSSVGALESPGPSARERDNRRPAGSASTALPGRREGARGFPGAAASSKGVSRRWSTFIRGAVHYHGSRRPGSPQVNLRQDRYQQPPGTTRAKIFFEEYLPRIKTRTPIAANGALTPHAADSPDFT